jgi:hypothetical protein
MKRILLSVFAAAITAAWAIPAGAADVTFGGEYRLRSEYRNNSDYNADASDADSFWAQRVRLTANAKATDDASVKITVQDTRTWGATGLLSDDTADDDVTTNDNFVDLHEAYVNVDKLLGHPISLRAGRQELVYGDQRQVGNGNWVNTARSFDALKFVYKSDMANLDVFTSKVTEGTGATNDDVDFHGAYLVLPKLVPGNSLDVYAFDSVDTSKPASRYTVGARLKGAVAGISYTGEGAFQTGTDESGATDTTLSGYAFLAKASYMIPNTPKLTIGAEFDYATGDDADTADENEAYNELYPTGHVPFGYIDIAQTKWSDIMAFTANASVEPTEQVKLYAAYWQYIEAEVAAGADDAIGSAIDFAATYKYNPAVSAELGGAYFMPGDAVATDGDATQFVYLMVTANF